MCHGGNVGCIRDNGFAAAFPNGLLIGDQSGLNGATGGFAALWTTSTAIRNYLPGGGPPSVLTADLTNPLSTPAGVLAAQLVSVKLDIGIAGTPGNLHFVKCVVPALIGKTINQLVAIADQAVAGGALPSGVTLSNINDALTAVNENFDSCSSNGGCLAP